MTQREDDAARAERQRRIFADGAVAAALSQPPIPPEDLGSMERYTWFDGYAYREPSVPNPYRSRRP